MTGIVITGHPPIRPPKEISRVQFFLVADSVGYGEAEIEALITNDVTLSEADKRGLLIRFRQAQIFPRDWDGLNAIAEDAGISSEQMDDLYRYGATL